MSSVAARHPMDPMHRTKWTLVVFAAVLLALIFAGSRLLRHTTRDRLVIPDEKVTAALLLERKLTGPEYFHRNAAARLAGDGEIHISLRSVQAQIPRIVQARNLNVEQAAKVERLVEKLAEPSPSRVVGETTINLLRLNLALDEIR